MRASHGRGMPRDNPPGWPWPGEDRPDQRHARMLSSVTLNGLAGVHRGPFRARTAPVTQEEKVYSMKALLNTTNGTGSTPAPTRGYLGHRVTLKERVALAAKHYEEGRPIWPTRAIAAFSYRVPLHMLAAAPTRKRSKRSKRNGHNGNGHNGNGHNGNGAETKSSLSELLLHATPAELIEAGRAFGVAHLWDAMIVPNLENHTAAE
jgi:hypothetical protein